MSQAINWECIEQNTRSTKWRLHRWSLEGQTWTLDKAIMAFDWSISGYLHLFVLQFAWLLVTHWEFLISFSLMHAWLLYSFETLACWLYWLIISTILTYWFFLLYDYSTLLDMYILLVAYLIHFDMFDFLGYILSWLSWSMLSLLDILLD